MSFGGVLGMIRTLKDNKSLLRGKNYEFKSNNREGIYSGEKGEVLKFKEVSKNQLEKIKVKIHLQLKKDQQKQLKILVFSVIVGLLILVWLANYISFF